MISACKSFSHFALLKRCVVKVTFVDVLSSLFPYSRNVLWLFEPLFFIKAVIRLCQSHDCYVCSLFSVFLLCIYDTGAESLFDIAHHTHMLAV